MSRPLRLEFPGALYRVTSRWDRREPIFEGYADREALMEIVGDAMRRFDACLLAWCLIGQSLSLRAAHPLGHLSWLMRHVNGVYTQRHNRSKVGHLFQGRFKAILVQEAPISLRCKVLGSGLVF
ncbi:MAG: hypothetical protein REI94_06460 [Moraxellaceae bacterium]|nr:hypothetical protein [Moraxellaceae bacterium]